MALVYHFTEEEIEDFQISSGELGNEITLNYAWDFAANKALASITKHNALSKILYGRANKTIDIRMIHHTRQAEKIADAILMTSSLPQIKASFSHNIKSLAVECGDDVSVTHGAGIGENGYQAAPGIVTSKRIIDQKRYYEVTMKPSGDLYKSELLMLTEVPGISGIGTKIIYENGIATITVYAADVQGSPPVEGAEVTIEGLKKSTDSKGQVSFTLPHGKYKAFIKTSDIIEMSFTI